MDESRLPAANLTIASAFIPDPLHPATVMPTESSAEGPATIDVADIRQRAAGLDGAALKDLLLETGILTREYGAGTIKLRGSYEVLQRSLNTMVQRAPNASGLSLEISGSQWARLFFPDNLLGGDAPGLDILNLRNCSLPGPLAIFRGLTHLSIHIYPPPTFPAPVYLGELLDFLDNTPQMENLELDDAFKLTRMDAELVPRRPKVRLPRLDYLDAAGSGRECNYLLGSLALPEDCEVRLTATAEGPQSVSALICAVERLVLHCCGPQRHCCEPPRLLRPFSHVDVVYRGDDDRNVLRVGFSPAFFYPPNVWWHAQCRLTLQCTPEHRPKVYRGVLFWLFRNIQGIQSIAFEQGVAHTCEHCTTDVLNVTDLFYILCGRNLDSVHTVRMPFGPVAAFCTALSQKGMMLAPSGQAIEGPMLRGLKTLVLGDGERCEWGELSDDEHDSDDEQRSSGEQRSSERRLCNPRVDGALADMVRRRKELQVPLERLVLKGYSKMEREFMDSLRAKVGNKVQIEETFLEHIGEERCTHQLGSSGTPCLGN